MSWEFLMRNLSFPMVIIGNRWVSGYTRIEEELYDCLAEAAGRDTESSGAGEKGSSEEAGGNPEEKSGTGRAVRRYGGREGQYEYPSVYHRKLQQL